MAKASFRVNTESLRGFGRFSPFTLTSLNSVFTLKEAFAIMIQYQFNPNVFYEKATNPDVHKKYLQLLMDRSSWYRRWNRNCNDNIIPDDIDYGIAKGAPPILKDT